MDKRKNNGGVRKNSGRKPKAQEQELIEKLSPLEGIAFEALKKGIEQNQSWAMKLFFEYKFGKAKEYKEIAIIEDIVVIRPTDES